MWVKHKVQIGPDTEINFQLIDDLIADENWVGLGIAITQLFTQIDRLKDELVWQRDAYAKDSKKESK